jgi:hypothetical protein
VPRLQEEDEPPHQVAAAVERRRQDDRLLQEQPVGLQEREVPVFRQEIAVGRNKTRRRMRLYPFCFWCERPVVLYLDKKNGNRPDQATTDHIFQKIWYPQGRPSGASVLSCHACNDERMQVAARIQRELRAVLDPQFSIDLGRRWSYPCPECAEGKGRRPGSFCSRECWDANRGGWGTRSGPAGDPGCRPGTREGSYGTLPAGPSRSGTATHALGAPGVSRGHLPDAVIIAGQCSR